MEEIITAGILIIFYLIVAKTIIWPAIHRRYKARVIGKKVSSGEFTYDVITGKLTKKDRRQ